MSALGHYLEEEGIATVAISLIRPQTENTKPEELLISHISINFDRTGFQEDWNVVFPLDRLNELAAEGTIGSVAATHYSFMGATDPLQMEPYARELAVRLKADAVDAVILPPV